MLTFLHCEQFSFKAHISITTCLNVLIFAIYVRNTSFKCSVIFILNIFVIVLLYLSWKNAICTKFWTGAVVRYYGNWKWCFYIVCHKPIKFEHLVGNILYLTIIMTFIPFEGKSKSYKHSIIIYWTALVHSNFMHIWQKNIIFLDKIKLYMIVGLCGFWVCHRYVKDTFKN